jgi:hypothetical protein
LEILFYFIFVGGNKWKPYFILFLGKNGYHKKINLSSTNGNFQNVKLMIFRENLAFWEETGEEKRKEQISRN